MLHLERLTDLMTDPGELNTGAILGLHISRTQQHVRLDRPTSRFTTAHGYVAALSRCQGSREPDRIYIGAGHLVYNHAPPGDALNWQPHPPGTNDAPIPVVVAWSADGCTSLFLPNTPPSPKLDKMQRAVEQMLRVKP